MVRRRSPPPKEKRIPKGWQEHDGSGCPVDPRSMPAVMFRGGTKIQPGKRAAEEWKQFASGDLWAWQDRRPDGFDIIAFKPEEGEWLTPPRLE